VGGGGGSSTVAALSMFVLHWPLIYCEVVGVVLRENVQSACGVDKHLCHIRVQIEEAQLSEH
jgi:hypothetical protein